jgi:hypothetical protein
LITSLRHLLHRLKPRGGASRPRSRRADALHVVVLCSFAFAQPLYDKLSERPAFLTDLGAGPGLLAGLIAALSLGLPLALLIPGALVARYGRRAYEPLYLAASCLLWSLISLPAIKRLPFLGAAAVLALALLAGALAVACYARFEGVRRMLTIAAVGVLLFPAMFLRGNAVRGLFTGPAGLTVRPAEPAPIVMLVLDEFSGATLLNEAREIDALRFPNFARLARQSTWFRNATTVHAYTKMAVPCILSGRMPPPVWMPMPADLPQNLFSLIEATGVYEQAVFEPVSRLAGNRSDVSRGKPIRAIDQATYLASTLARVYLDHVSPAEFSRKLPRIPKLWFGLRESLTVDATGRRGVFRYDWGERRDRQFAHFLRCIEEGDQPTLYFLHLLLPHLPWCFLPTGQRYAEDSDQWGLASFSISDGPGDFWGSDELFVLHGQQRYLLQVQYVDQLIGQLLDRLEQTGLLDRCLLIVMADHGVAFRASEPRRTISAAVREEILSVPLFIKRQGQKQPRVSDRRVQTIDLLPTIADALGMALPMPVDGRSVFDEGAPDRSHISFVNAQEQKETIPALTVGVDVARSIRARFGEAGDSDAIYSAGPSPALVGRSVAEFLPAAASAYKLELLPHEGQVDPNEPLVPCFFEGYVRPKPPLNQPPMLAVAIDGTIRAVTRTYLLQGLHDRWAALVPPSTVRQDASRVQFYEVTRNDQGWQLARCDLVASAAPGAVDATP